MICIVLTVVKEVQNVAGVLERWRKKKLVNIKEVRRVLVFFGCTGHLHRFSRHQAKMTPSFIVFVIRYIRNGLM